MDTEIIIKLDMHTKKNTRGGFTLIEVLIAFSIVALATIGLFVNWRIQQERGYDSKRKSDLTKLTVSLEDYYNDNSCYPTTDLWTSIDCKNLSTSSLEKYIKQAPCDPQTNTRYTYQTIDASGDLCEGGCGSCSGYRILTTLSNAADPAITAIGCSPSNGCGYSSTNGKILNYGVAAGGPFTPPGFIPVVPTTPIGGAGINNPPVVSPTAPSLPSPTIIPTSTPTIAPSPTPVSDSNTNSSGLNKNVFLIGYNPTENGVSVAEKYFGWLMGGKTVEQYEDQSFNEVIQVFSNMEAKINFTIVKKIHVTTFQPYGDGFTYTLDTYKKCVSGGTSSDMANCESRKWQFNYNQWLTINTICSQLAQTNADEVWMLSPPFIMAYENFMIGPNAGFSINGPSYTDTTCMKHYAVINGTYDRGDLIMHDIGHRIEATMSYLTQYWQSADTQKYWDNFASTGKYSNRTYSTPVCGNAHYPFNTSGAYDYWNNSSSASNCPDWNNLPNFKGTTTTGNCSLWGCKDAGWQAYWFGAIPHSNGTLSLTSRTGKQFQFSKNWWEYILNPDLAISMYSQIK